MGEKYDPLPLELPKWSEFSKKRLLKIIYRSSDVGGTERRNVHFDDESELRDMDLGIYLNGLLRAVVYKQRSLDMGWPFRGMNVYEENPHFEKKLLELQKPYHAGKSRKSEPDKAAQGIPVVSDIVHLPTFDGAALYFQGGITYRSDDSKLSLVKRLSGISGWDYFGGWVPNQIERNWDNLVQEAEQCGANIVAKGTGKYAKGRYYLFTIFNDALKPVEKYSVENLKGKSIHEL